MKATALIREPSPQPPRPPAGPLRPEPLRPPSPAGRCSRPALGPRLCAPRPISVRPRPSNTGISRRKEAGCAPSRPSLSRRTQTAPPPRPSGRRPPRLPAPGGSASGFSEAGGPAAGQPLQPGPSPPAGGAPTRPAGPPPGPGPRAPPLTSAGWPGGRCAQHLQLVAACHPCLLHRPDVRAPTLPL